MKGLRIALVPLVLGYALYSLYYHEHTGWYSYILRVGVGCVYSFGFATMLPQLYLNYKLKSVSHLPWRMLTYKFLTTIIDDLFAFIIKMPTLHRLACFRDDVVFIIFIIQKFIYKTDYNRTNEYGISFEDHDDSGNDNADNKDQRPQVNNGRPQTTTNTTPNTNNNNSSNAPSRPIVTSQVDRDGDDESSVDGNQSEDDKTDSENDDTVLVRRRNTTTNEGDGQGNRGASASRGNEDDVD